MIACKVTKNLGPELQVQDVNFDRSESARILKIKVNQNEARLVALSSQDIARTSTAMISGMKIYPIHKSTFPVDVLIRTEVLQRESHDS